MTRLHDCQACTIQQPIFYVVEGEVPVRLQVSNKLLCIGSQLCYQGQFPSVLWNKFLEKLALQTFYKLFDICSLLHWWDLRLCQSSCLVLGIHLSRIVFLSFPLPFILLSQFFLLPGAGSGSSNLYGLW